MDMKINCGRIKSERLTRAWSQEQLAAAAGLSLRTIQRIEASGIAANESALALAAVFGCNVASLIESTAVCEIPTKRRFPVWSIKIGAAFSSGALLGVLFAGALTASAVDLKVEGYLNGKQRVARKAQGTEPVTIPLTDENARERARVDIQVSELKDGRVRFDLTLYECKEGNCAATTRPQMITRPGVPAKVIWTSSEGDVFTYEITPVT